MSRTFQDLATIASILGTTKASLWPILDGPHDDAANASQHTYGSGGAIAPASFSDEGGPLAPSVVHLHRHTSGLYSWHNLSAENQHLAVLADNASHTFGDGAEDAAFSLGAWVLFNEALGTVRTIIAKYRSTAAEAREYDFRISTIGRLVLELYDESADATEISTGGTAITPRVWAFVVATYNGNEADPRIHLYLNGVDTNSDGLSVETGAYVAMENLAAPLLIGARDLTDSPEQEFEGRIALPFVTGKALTSSEVARLYSLGRTLLDT